MSTMDFERNPENVGGVAGYRWGGRVRPDLEKAASGASGYSVKNPVILRTF